MFLETRNIFTRSAWSFSGCFFAHNDNKGRLKTLEKRVHTVHEEQNVLLNSSFFLLFG